VIASRIAGARDVQGEGVSNPNERRFLIRWMINNIRDNPSTTPVRISQVVVGKDALSAMTMPAMKARESQSKGMGRDGGKVWA